jgi:hypothetical protein
MGRRRRNSVVPYVVLGAAVSIGVVALTASRFGWRRTKAEPAPEVGPTTEIETIPEVEAEAEAAKGPRFKPAPPRDADAPRWDTPPADYAKSGPASP